MKYTLFLTQRCNLTCDYCYVGKRDGRMPFGVAMRAIDFGYRNTPAEEDIEFGFFGGEPLLEYPLLVELTKLIENHPQYERTRVKLGLATNGTLLTPEMLQFFREHAITATISCDGPPSIHDRHRHFADSRGSSALVEQSIRTSVALCGGNHTSVNAVYGPRTLEHLAETVDYFADLGVRQISLNPDFSARWTEADIEKVPGVYEQLARRYMQYYRQGRPHYISLLDSKITVLLRGGYQPEEKCRMGTGEFAFTPSGEVYPCERLAAADPRKHAIGSVKELVQIRPLPKRLTEGTEHPACTACSIRDYCVHWCGCSNFFQSGYYNRVGPFLCTSEKTLLRLAAEVLATLESELGPTFTHHLGHGRPPKRETAPPAGPSPGHGYFQDPADFRAQQQSLVKEV